LLAFGADIRIQMNFKIFCKKLQRHKLTFHVRISFASEMLTQETAEFIARPQVNFSNSAVHWQKETVPNTAACLADKCGRLKKVKYTWSTSP